MRHFLLEELSVIDEFMLTVFAVLLLVDWLLIVILRDLVLQFFNSRGNRKKKKLLHSKQSFWDRVSLNYIRPMLRKNLYYFDIFHRLYLVLIIIFIPQYILLLILLLLVRKAALVTLLLLCAVKMVMFIIVRFQFDSHWVSKYK